MPVDQAGRVPEQHGQRQIQNHAGQHGGLKAVSFGNFLGQRSAAQVDVGKVAAIKHGGQANDQQQPHHIEDAQLNHGAGASAVTAKCDQQQVQLRAAVMGGFRGRHHHGQRNSW